MKKIIKKYFGEISLVIGVGTFFYNIFNFSYRTFGKGGLLPKLPGSDDFEGIAYFYSSDVLIMIAVGAILMTIGILIIKNKQL